ncbi:hypothetical protein BYT27DRAFT_6609038 [Phlegmacium glaucopus]|nr:hypothetical protein BYT27DRAFT_6609038 [Phlegmacium glaucopus]
MPRGRRNLAGDQLFTAMGAGIESSGDAGSVILRLMDHYNVNLDDLRRFGLERGLNVSFSRVKYKDIAPRVDLQPDLCGRDMPTFDICRARIPNSLFREIISDIQMMLNQYGEPDSHKNEEARSRFLSPLFNRIVSLFELTIVNTPESIIPGRMTTKGRIEYHFSVFGGLSILVIEVKFSLRSADEHFDAIAQVIAECDACSYANDQREFPPSLVYGILCDGITFEFFSFDGSTVTNGSRPTFSRGVLYSTATSPGVHRLTVANCVESPTQFIASLRPICETLFYLFLVSYKTGVSAYLMRSTVRGQAERRTRRSFPGWVIALDHAEKALTLATIAAAEARAYHDSDSINDTTDMALYNLGQSLASVPATHKTDIDLLRTYDERDFTYC